MSIKLVINGYFRSGTSALWNELKCACYSPVFYEPCHPKLLKYVVEAKKERKLNTLHNMHLWDEYFNVENISLELASIKSPSVNEFALSQEELDTLFKVLDLSDNVILQSNRWHLASKMLNKKTKGGFYQVLRNPYDVYSSIRVSYFDEDSLIKKALKYIMYPISRVNMFYLKRQYDCLDYIHVTPKNNPSGLGAYLYRTFDLFFLNWVLFNYYAISDLPSENIIVYESFNGEKLIEILKISGVPFDSGHSCNFKSRRKEFISANEKEKLIKLSRKLGIENEFLKILDVVEKA